MKTLIIPIALLLACVEKSSAAEITLESAPPVVVKTSPTAGAVDVAPTLQEVRVTFSKAMKDGSWSWSTWGEENFPKLGGDPRYLADGRTCVLPVKLEPGKFYAIWLNSEKFKNFKDPAGHPAVPYLLTFKTGSQSGETSTPTAVTPGPEVAKIPVRPPSSSLPSDAVKLLNADQRTVLDWTDARFGSFFDARSFESYSGEERLKLEQRLIDALSGPRSTEYYQAINSLGALRSTNALPKLREIAFDRREKDNRDRWMAVRALGIMGDRASVPELIHLVYHGNTNTRWWAQLSLIALTGQNFGSDWQAWGKWWNDQGDQLAFKAEMVRWSQNPEWSEPEKLAKNIAVYDQKFLDQLRGGPRKTDAPAKTP
jgi:hypothetical protein